MSMNGESQEEAMQRQEEAQERQQMLGRASQMGGGASSIQEQFESDDLLDRLLDYDINDVDDEHDDLENTLTTEFSRVYMTSNLSPREVDMMQVWTDQEAHLLSLEHAQRGTLATGTRGQIMYGSLSPAEETEAKEDGQLPEGQTYRPRRPLSDSEERRIWSAADAKKAALSRSRNGWLIKRFTEFVAVGKTENRREEAGKGGFLSGLKERLI